MKTRLIILSALISMGLLFGACGQATDTSPRKDPPAVEKKSVDRKKAVRVRHLSGEVIAVNSKTKTLTVRFKDREVGLRFDDNTIVKIDLDTVKPSEIPLGTRATVKYVETKGQYIVRGIFISTETAEKKEGAPQSFYRNSARQAHPTNGGFPPVCA